MPAPFESKAFAEDGADSEATEEDSLQRELVVDLEFEDVELYEVLLQILFLPSNFRIVGRDDFPVTATLRAANLDDAIEQLCEQTGLLAVKRGAFWTVYSAGAEEELQQLGVDSITYLFRCRNARAADVVDIIEGKDPQGFPRPRPLLPESGQLGVLPLPTEGPGYEIPTDITDVDTPGRGIRLPLGRVQYELVPHLNGVLIKGPLSEVRQSVDFLRVLDRPMPLVLIELLIVQYFHGDQFSWRFDLANGQIAKGQAPRVNQFGEPIGTSIYDAEKGTPPGPGNYPFGPRPFGVNLEQVGISAANGGGPLAFSAVGSLTASFKQNVQLLCSKNEARVVTNPHIAVVSGHEGTIELDEIFNFTTSTVFPTAGATVTGERQEITSTTVFTVTPTVVSPDSIHLAINSELGVFVESIAGLISELPDQRKNKISTSVVLGETETLIIGGLVKEDAAEVKDSIPFFSRLPVVGALFRGRDADRQFTETVIYITPHISIPQGFEDAYFKQIFQQMERLQERGHNLNDERREDAMRARAYCISEEEAARARRKAERLHRYRRGDCNCAECQAKSAAARNATQESGSGDEDSPPTPPQDDDPPSQDQSAYYHQQGRPPAAGYRGSPHPTTEAAPVEWAEARPAFRRQHSVPRQSQYAPAPYDYAEPPARPEWIGPYDENTARNGVKVPPTSSLRFIGNASDGRQSGRTASGPSVPNPFRR